VGPVLAISIILLVSPALGAGKLKIRGVVVDEKGNPIEGARVIAGFGQVIEMIPTTRAGERRVIVRETQDPDPYFYSNANSMIPGNYIILINMKNPQFKRETYSDKDGRWGIFFLEPGRYRLTAFTGEMMSKTQILEVRQDAEEVKLVVDTRAIAVLIQVKKFINKRDYDSAIKMLQWYKEHFPNSRQLENAVYWSAYSRYQLCDFTKSSKKIRRISLEAIKDLEFLVKKFPDGEWVDDARILHIEFAHKLFDLGVKKYKNHIISEVYACGEKDIDIKIAALDALLDIDRDRAVDYMLELLVKPGHNELKQKVIFLLGSRQVKEAVTSLTRLAQADPDPMVKQSALYWLKKIKPPKSK